MKTFAAALAVLALALLPAAASAKEGVELSSLPDFLKAGQSWEVDVHMALFPGERPLPPSGVGIEIAHAGRTIRYPGSRLPDLGYHVHVVFPSAGRWSYKVVGPTPIHQQNWAPVDIAAAPAAPHSSGSSFPYGWVIGGGGALVLALCGVGISRFRAGRAAPRPGASPS